MTYRPTCVKWDVKLYYTIPYHYRETNGLTQTDELEGNAQFPLWGIITKNMAI